jgi:hypothetical protein
MATLPTSRPQASRATVLSAARKQWVKAHPDTYLPDSFLLFVRGYYFRTMGDPTKNDRGIYDDAAFVVGPEVFASFHANSDPSIFRVGIATLLPGFYPYRLGNHGISRPGGGYPALRPATPGEALPVKRDGESRIPSARPGIAINIHRGGYNTTSSEGCQTIHPTQWAAFYALARAEVLKQPNRRIWVGIIEGPIN